MINLYEMASGSKCNIQKTELLAINHDRTEISYDLPIRYDGIVILGVFLGTNRTQPKKKIGRIESRNVSVFSKDGSVGNCLLPVRL